MTRLKPNQMTTPTDQNGDELREKIIEAMQCNPNHKSREGDVACFDDQVNRLMRFIRSDRDKAVRDAERSSPLLKQTAGKDRERSTYAKAEAERQGRIAEIKLAQDSERDLSGPLRDPYWREYLSDRLATLKAAGEGSETG